MGTRASGFDEREESLQLSFTELVGHSWAKAERCHPGTSTPTPSTTHRRYGGRRPGGRLLLLRPLRAARRSSAGRRWNRSVRHGLGQRQAAGCGPRVHGADRCHGFRPCDRGVDARAVHGNRPLVSHRADAPRRAGGRYLGTRREQHHRAELRDDHRSGHRCLGARSGVCPPALPPPVPTQERAADLHRRQDGHRRRVRAAGLRPAPAHTGQRDHRSRRRRQVQSERQRAAAARAGSTFHDPRRWAGG